MTTGPAEWVRGNNPAALGLLFYEARGTIPIFAADPYTPSAEEVRDPELFAENVRKVTLECL